MLVAIATEGNGTAQRSGQGRDKDDGWNREGIELRLKDKTDGKSHRRGHADLGSRGLPESCQVFRAKGISWSRPRSCNTGHCQGLRHLQT